MSPFHRVDILHEGRVIRVERSPQGYASADELNGERRRLCEALDELGRAGRGLLIDSRAAPHSTDERLQDAFRRFRLEVVPAWTSPAAPAVRAALRLTDSAARRRTGRRAHMSLQP